MTRLLRRTRGGDAGPDGGETREVVGDDRQEAEAKATGTADATQPTEPDVAEAAEARTAETTEPGAAGPTAVETPDPGPESATDQDDPGPGKATGRRSAVPWRKAALAVALTGLLLGGSWFFYAAHQLRSTPAARNHALTDTATTDRVSGEVAEGLARVFSYTPADTDAAERSSRTVLAGRAARQYGDLLAQVRTKLVGQRITLSTQAVRTGVVELDGDSARLLVFLDQTSRRDKGAPTSAAAQLTVTAKHEGDRWLIVDIKAR
ncbi:hypothetical protein [Streptomyces sp. NPDC002463]|uniref:hypothetical protein n=1 Tax=Streptomyces sp. NPDC002463 TaxID=3364645 RepID=UPI0036C33DC5